MTAPESLCIGCGEHIAEGEPREVDRDGTYCCEPTCITKFQADAYAERRQEMRHMCDWGNHYASDVHLVGEDAMACEQCIREDQMASEDDQSVHMDVVVVEVTGNVAWLQLQPGAAEVMLVMPPRDLARLRPLVGMPTTLSISAKEVA